IDSTSVNSQWNLISISTNEVKKSKLRNYVGNSNYEQENSIVDIDFILQNIKTSKVEIKNDNFEIYGNLEMSDKEFRDVVNNGSPKIYLIYRTDREIDLPYDALLKVKRKDKTCSYEFVEKDKDDSKSILNGITSFIEKYTGIINNKEYYELESNIPMTLSDSVPTTFIDCVVDKGFWWAAQTKNGSADLIVRAGELQDIYGFCSGMI
ncbi:MAG: hypothetical protein K2N64_00485, partial [Anaeroplasmataceae bacterium]|nr:hypothetical protein [Anaeroplasmataceae bacterium]